MRVPGHERRHSVTVMKNRQQAKGLELPTDVAQFDEAVLAAWDGEATFASFSREGSK